ncbi:hypothetical protein B9G39_07540 [Zooshikella ganghwensis]|uniref:RHS repeat-associated core domain-containing protein n=2 Tax=Zooshikella ganghwensis TaxID=202772 RepID=A0A4P9VJ74_9GAMM|nr:hypothetical protein B9G39_07540 [Zooshikella ganghwensis]
MNMRIKDKKTIALHQADLSNVPCLSRRGFLIKSSYLLSATSLLSLNIPAKAAISLNNTSSDNLSLIILHDRIGFNGEYIDPITNVYHLGNGYRIYNPRLMRFHSIDSLSPFGDGGINGYSYCLGDPLNLVDPTGHISWQAGVAIGLGIAAILIGIVTLGAGIAASAGLVTGAAAITTAGVLKAGLGVASGLSGIISGGLGIASGVLSETHPMLSTNLGYAAFAFGITSAVTGIGSLFAGARVASAATRVIRTPLSSGLLGSRSTGQVTLKLSDSIARYNPRFVAKALNKTFHNELPFHRIAISGEKAPSLFKGSSFITQSYAQQLSNHTGKQVIELARRGAAIAPQSRRASSVPSILNSSVAVTKSAAWTPTRVFGPSRVLYTAGMIGRSLMVE